MKLTKSILLGFAFSAATLLVSCDDKKESTEGSGSKESAEGSGSSAAVVDTPDSLTDELIVEMNKFADILLSAKDKASAEAAAKKLPMIGDEITAIAARMDKLDTPSEAVKIALDAKMEATEKAMEKRMGGFAETMGTNPEVAQIIGPAMQEFVINMNKNDKIFKRFGKKE